MDKKAVAKIIEDFRLALERRGVRVAMIVLYGSHATGTARDWSDIDLVVVSKDFEGKRFRERIRPLVDVIYEMWKPIEAVPKTPQEWEDGTSLIVQFAKQGEVVYRAESA